MTRSNERIPNFYLLHLHRFVAISLTSNTSGGDANVDDDSNDGANGTDSNGDDSNMLEQRSRR
jgi:hypothetical protein